MYQQVLGEGIESFYESFQKCVAEELEKTEAQRFVLPLRSYWLASFLLTGQSHGDFLVDGVQDLDLHGVDDRGDDAAPRLTPVPRRTVHQVPSAVEAGMNALH